MFWITIASGFILGSLVASYSENYRALFKTLCAGIMKLSRVTKDDKQS